MAATDVFAPHPRGLFGRRRRAEEARARRRYADFVELMAEAEPPAPIRWAASK